MNLFKALIPGAGQAADAAARVRAGRARLVDVREPAEWVAGVAKGAALLPLSDLTGARTGWREFLRTAGDCDLVLYCAAGARAGKAASLLRTEGFRAENGGGLRAWADSGWPVVKPPRDGSAAASKL
jgi:rhodanese-related sulfurtransferase